VLHVVTTHETPHDTEGFRFFLSLSADRGDGVCLIEV
jgi:hypothetical protein